MLKKISIIVSVIVVMAALLVIQAVAANTTAPNAGDITITNSLSGTPDKIEIDNVLVKDIIRVYSTATGGAPIGVSVADSTPMIFYINQLGLVDGTVYVTVTSTGFTESDRTAVSYVKEKKTDAPVFNEVTDITIQNNVMGLPDLITVSNLTIDDTVRIYPNSVSTVPLGTVVSTGSSATLYINQLGVAAGTLYVTVQGKDALESARTRKDYDSETTTTLAANAVSVVNNFYTKPGGIQPDTSKDTVTVTDVAEGDTVTVYKAPIGTEVLYGPTILGQADVIGGAVVIKIDQLGTKAGKVYVTLTIPGKAESKRAAYSYLAEPVSGKPVAGTVKVTNNYNAADAVDVSGLAEGDVVTVYNTLTSPAPLGSDTVGTGETTVTIPINMSVLSATGGTLYVTITSTGKNESDRVAVSYGKEITNKALLASNVIVSNNYNIVDTVNVKNLTAGDIINVYSASIGGTLITSGTASGTEITLPLGTTTLLAKGGNIYLTITTTAAAESTRTPVAYKPEPVTTAPAASTITVMNNYTQTDTVTITGLKEADEVRIYTAMTGGTQIGMNTVAAAATSTTVDIADKLLSATGGKIYVSVRSAANESSRTLVSYKEEATTTAPNLATITVTNNYLVPDSIVVTGVNPNDVVTIYTAATGTAIIKSGTVAAGQTSIQFTPDTVQLSGTGGKIFVSVKIPLANESPRTAAPYASEKTATPVAGTVTVTNNYYIASDSSTKDNVRISGAAAGDKIYIYKSSGGTDKWAGPVIAAADGAVDITIDQLGPKAGNIYVSVTKLDRSESARVSVPFPAEKATTAPLPANIIIDNNFAADDIVTINNLTVNQIVTLYATTSGTALLTPITATGTSYTFVLDDGVLAAAGGKLYVSVKDADKQESVRTAQTYTSETTAMPKTTNILVVNYPGTAYDTVTIVGLTAGDIVKIYDKNGAVLVTATLAGKGTTLTLDTNLPDTGSTINVTVTSIGKAESKRVAVAYQDA